MKDPPLARCFTAFTFFDGLSDLSFSFLLPSNILHSSEVECEVKLRCNLSSLEAQAAQRLHHYTADSVIAALPARYKSTKGKVHCLTTKAIPNAEAQVFLIQQSVLDVLL